MQRIEVQHQLALGGATGLPCARTRGGAYSLHCNKPLAVDRGQHWSGPVGQCANGPPVPTAPDCVGQGLWAGSHQAMMLVAKVN
jgi:hypothetical protein